ncbi:OmpA Outer membrane protein and related peptidoglycan-associated (lipo)proteins [Comamonadaceae bacterium]
MNPNTWRLLPLARLGLGLPLALLSGLSVAQATDTRGYLLDGAGRFVGSSTPGQCWHNGEWTPALAVAPCDAVIVAATPVVVAAAPVAATPVAPSVVITPVPVAPAVQRLNFSADALFGFDKSVIGPNGMAMLDGLVVELSGSTYDAIHVRGYTDRIGTNAYNQKLSLRRATAVSDYLVAKGVAAASIQSYGEGESNPLTMLADCPGGKRLLLIECLQRDRRVEVDVQGSKPAER